MVHWRILYFTSSLYYIQSPSSAAEICHEIQTEKEDRWANGYCWWLEIITVAQWLLDGCDDGDVVDPDYDIIIYDQVAINSSKCWVSSLRKHTQSLGFVFRICERHSHVWMKGWEQRQEEVGKQSDGQKTDRGLLEQVWMLRRISTCNGDLSNLLCANFSQVIKYIEVKVKRI